MNSIDLSPFYRSSIGYDRVGALIDNALRASDSTAGYPPYNIEALDESHYAITLAVAGFKRENVEITIENNVLTICGNRGKEDTGREYLHQGIANRAFERRFNLAEFIEVTHADLTDGLLTINLKREIPEAMKPRSIQIREDKGDFLEHEAKAASPDGGGKKAAA